MTKLRIGLALVVAALLLACSTPRSKPAETANDTRPAETASDPNTAGTVPRVAPMGTLQGRLAYIDKGDLFVRESLTGTSRRLTDDGKNDSPVWSPSGRWLLFQKDRAYWVIRRDGSRARELLPSERAARPVWAPNEDVVAFADGGRIEVMGVDGSGARTLVKGGDAESLGDLAWSPDGSLLLYSIRRQPASAGEPFYDGLWLVPSQGGRPRELYAVHGDAPQCLTTAGWTADGTGALFQPIPSCSNSIAADGLPLMFVPAEGGTPHQLVGSMLGYPDFLALAAGSRFAAVAGAGRMSWTQKRIVVGDAKSGRVLNVSPSDQAAISPAWAPDGRQLAYVAMPDKGDSAGGEAMRAAMMQRRLWLVRPDGSEARHLTPNEGFRDESPHWTGDGRHILFARLNEKGEASLWVVGADDSVDAPATQANPTTPAAQAAPATLVAHLDPPVTEAGITWFGYYGWINWSRVFDFQPLGR